MECFYASCTTADYMYISMYLEISLGGLRKYLHPMGADTSNLG